MRGTWWTAVGVVLLTFTGGADVRADAAQSGPRGEVGARIRAGTIVGFTELDGEHATAIGAQVAVGQRFGPITLEAELDTLSLIDGRESGVEESVVRRGKARRVGVTGRLDVLTLGSRLIGPRSAVVLWVETGVGRQRAQWDGSARILRSDAHAGFGWLLDHRTNRSQRIPAFGWHVGWRFLASDVPIDSPNTIALCRGKTCKPSDMEDRHDLGFLVSSSLVAHW